MPPVAAQAHAGGAHGSELRHERERDVERIRLERDLGPGAEPQALVQDAEQAFESVGAEVRRRSAAEVERVDGEWLGDPLQFPLERRQVATDEVVAAGEQREIAVAAPVPAEGHVDVGVAGRGR